MAELLPVMVLYHPVSVSQFSQTDEQAQATIAEYASRLIADGVTAEGFSRGMEAMKRRAETETFAPNPAEFAAMCRLSAKEIGIPDFREVLAEIIDRNGRNREREYSFSHQLTAIISQRVGPKIRELTAIDFEKLLHQEYRHWRKIVESGKPLPEVRLVIENKKRIDFPVDSEQAKFLKEHWPKQSGREIFEAIAFGKTNEIKFDDDDQP